MNALISNDPVRTLSRGLAFTESSWALLAGMRFVLAAIVVVVHLPWFAELPAALKPLLSLGGRAAVLGFLFISGVSIGHSYLTQPNGYFQRRFLRIYPLYFIAVVFSLVLTYAIGSHYETPFKTWETAGWKTNFGNLFFLQEFASIPITYNLPLWTISIEVFFYVLVPWLSKLPAGVLVGLIAGSMFLFTFTHKEWLFGYPAARYAWPWLTGFLFAMTGHRRVFVILAGMGMGATVLNRVDTGEPFCWLTIAMVAAVILLAERADFPVRLKTVLNFLGEQSYPLYLFHAPLLLALYRYAGVHHALALTGLTLILIVPINHVFDHWLKNVFWKPLVRRVSQAMNKRFTGGKLSPSVVPGIARQ